MKKVFCLLAIFVLGFGIAPVAYAGEGSPEEGYAAGRQWAADNNVVDEDFQSGESENFNNGVRQYALEQHQRELQADDDIQPD